MTRLEVQATVIDCEACPRRSSARLPVPIRGTASAEVAIVAGAPSSDEDRAGQALADAAGALLFERLAAVGFDQDELAAFFTVACHGPQSPTPEEAAACAPNRELQLELADARYVLLLGALALRTANPALRTVQALGRPFERQGTLFLATYNPAQALDDAEVLAKLDEHLKTFAMLVAYDSADSTPGAWSKLIADTCSACDDWGTWITDEGLPWCVEHIPAPDRDRYLEWTAVSEERSEQRALEQAEMDDAEWSRHAWEVLIGYLRDHDEFFVDDFWSETELRVPREARALGPLVNRAAREGFMEKTGEFRKSKASNMTEKPIWKSCLREVSYAE